MPQTINTNIIALNAQRNLAGSQSSLTSSMQRLSSGLRVNSAKDDAAGLAIAERMTSQVRGMNVAIRNANDGISMSQTAEGAMGKVADSLQRMRELSVQAANATNSNSDKDSLDKEFGELAKEIQRVLGGTTFNGLNILGTEAAAFKFQVGANTTADDTIDITTIDLTADATITAVAGTDNTGAGRAVIDNTADASKSVNYAASAGTTAAVPVGVVVSRGSNANGEYVRYHDGTQICWATVNGGAALRTWTFPAAFSYSVGASATALRTASTTARIAIIRTLSTGALDTAVFDTSFNLTADPILCTAFGRWY